MKLKMVKIFDVYSVINRVTERSIKEKIPGVVALKLARVARELDSIVVDFEKQRRSLLEKYGERDKDNPDAFQISNEKLEAFNTELNAMLELEMEINVNVVLEDSDFSSINIDVAEAYTLLSLLEK